MERKSSVWELLPSLLFVFLGIKALIETIQYMLYFSQGGAFVMTIAFCGYGAAALLAAGFMVFYGLWWARKVLRGEYTGAELPLRLKLTTDTEDGPVVLFDSDSEEP